MLQFICGFDAKPKLRINVSFSFDSSLFVQTIHWRRLVEPPHRCWLYWTKANRFNLIKCARVLPNQFTIHDVHTLKCFKLSWNTIRTIYVARSFGSCVVMCSARENVLEMKWFMWKSHNRRDPEIISNSNSSFRDDWIDDSLGAQSHDCLDLSLKNRKLE